LEVEIEIERVDIKCLLTSDALYLEFTRLRALEFGGSRQREISQGTCQLKYRLSEGAGAALGRSIWDISYVKVRAPIRVTMTLN
jgi:hypothetical protein